MNKNTILMLCGTLVVGAVIGFFIGMIPSKKISNDTFSQILSLPEISALSDDYLAKVEQYGISVDDYTNTVDEVKKNLPPEQLAQLAGNEALFNANIFESLINQTVVVATAIEEGFLEKPENLKLFRNATQQALLNLYIAQNAPSDSNAFAPSKAQIDQAFQQFGAQLTANGMNATQVKEYIVTQLIQQNRQRWVLEFMSKIREKFRIERNETQMSNQNISASPTGAAS
ncbi:MAG: hypothetical protein ACRCVW_06340 [Brevinema sp.]